MNKIRCNVGFMILTAAGGIFGRGVHSDVDSVYRTRSESVPAPIVVPPSQYFEGVDGEWSTFSIRVGTPAQSVRVIVSTNSPETLVVLPGGCTTSAIDPVPSDCTSSRGGTFNDTLSKSWTDQGIFGINGVSYGFEANLGYNFDADYGLDTLGLGYTDGANGPTLKNQTIATYAMASPLYTGIFGLGTQPVIYQTFGNSSVPSFFQSLKDQNLIPSLTWSHTAGAKYRLKAGQFAQLIFGGYDSSRFQPSSVTFSINADVTHDLLVGVQSIIYEGETTTSLLEDPIYAFVESTDPNIWLPESACALFEKAFGITWNDTLSMYLINSTQYTLLSRSKPTVTFSLASTTTGGSTVDIKLPFEAFALQASYPFVENTTYYFPLKRAANDTQYTLGRAFLQEAYLTVDYDRGNFSINQCTWVDGATSNIVSIDPVVPNSTSNSTENPALTAAPSVNSVSTGAIIGIVIAIIAIAILGLALFFLRRYKRQQQERESHLLSENLAVGDLKNAMNDKKHNTIDPNITELYSPKPHTSLLKYDNPLPSPLSRSQTQTPTSELGGGEAQIYQLDGESRQLELGNTDLGYRYELSSESAVELPAEAIIRSELASPTLGKEINFQQFRGQGMGPEIRIERPHDFERVGRRKERQSDERPLSWDRENGLEAGVGLVMMERDKERGSSRSSGWRASLFRHRDSRSPTVSPGPSLADSSTSRYGPGFL